MINIREMTISDIGLLDIKDQWLVEKYIRYLQSNVGPAWIMEDEKGPLCAFGGAILWAGVGEIWYRLIRRDKIKSQIEKAKKLLEEQGKLYNIRRFYGTVNCNSPKSIRFAEFFGFYNETPNGMKSYNPDGSDAYMYARIIK
jgi:hypothetical protein